MARAMLLDAEERGLITPGKVGHPKHDPACALAMVWRNTTPCSTVPPPSAITTLADSTSSGAGVASLIRSAVCLLCRAYLADHPD